MCHLFSIFWLPLPSLQDYCHNHLKLPDPTTFSHCYQVLFSLSYILQKDNGNESIFVYIEIIQITHEQKPKKVKATHSLKGPHTGN